MRTTPYNRPGSLRARFKRAAAFGTNLSRQRRGLAYLAVTTLALLAVWMPVILFVLVMPDRYSSDWTLILPGSGAGSAVNLESIGHASSTVASPYTSSAVDPRVNYKAISESEAVLSAAAEELSLDLASFGKPKIKIVDQAALMHFTMRGATAVEAQQKSQALYRALQTQLNELRRDESYWREQGTRRMLDDFNDKLVETQSQILDYQTESGMVSVDQFNELILTIELLQRERATLMARHEGMRAELQSLSAGLGLNADQSGDALRLLDDQVFQHLLLELADPVAKLAEYTAKWGDQHPKVVKERSRETSVRSALRRRVVEVLGHADNTTLRLLTAGNGNSRSVLLSKQIDLSAQESGVAQQLGELAVRIQSMEEKLRAITPEVATLESLRRKHQVATAVFTSALAKQDIGKTNPFSSYPLVQMLVPPSYPDEPDRAQRTLALGGGVAASLLIIIGMVLLWIRKPYLQKILMNV